MNPSIFQVHPSLWVSLGKIGTVDSMLIVPKFRVARVWLLLLLLRGEGLETNINNLNNPSSMKEALATLRMNVMFRPTTPLPPLDAPVKSLSPSSG